MKKETRRMLELAGLNEGPDIKGATFESMEAITDFVEKITQAAEDLSMDISASVGGAGTGEGTDGMFVDGTNHDVSDEADSIVSKAFKGLGPKLNSAIKKAIKVAAKR